MGKCVSNNIGHPFPILWLMLSHVMMLYLNCGNDVLMPLLGDFGIFGRFSPIENVSRCYCQHYG